MTDDYGKRIGSAIKAVVQMQADSIRLLRDLDRDFQGYKVLLGNVVTLHLGNSINNASFLADGFFRHYSPDATWGRSLVATICFFDLRKPERLPEPVFVAANIEYLNPEPDATEKLKRAWDGWYGFVEWAQNRDFHRQMIVDCPSQREIGKMILAAAPLYSITTIEAATKLVDLVGRP